MITLTVLLIALVAALIIGLFLGLPYLLVIGDVLVATLIIVGLIELFSKDKSKKHKKH